MTAPVVRLLDAEEARARRAAAYAEQRAAAEAGWGLAWYVPAPAPCQAEAPSRETSP